MRATTKISPKETERAEAAQTLRQCLRPGDVVYTILRHVSASGMSRSIDLVTIRDGVPWVITFLAARVMQARIDEWNGGIKVGGGGMDMGFHLVYALGRRLFADGFYCTGEGHCPANDHNNEKGGGVYAVARKHSDPGYALRQRWI